MYLLASGGPVGRPWPSGLSLRRGGSRTALSRSAANLGPVSRTPYQGDLRLDFAAAGAAFALVFVMETGDKTQLMVLTLASRTGRIFPVVLGAALGLITAALIGALAGGLLGQLIPLEWLPSGRRPFRRRRPLHALALAARVQGSARSGHG